MIIIFITLISLLFSKVYVINWRNSSLNMFLYEIQTISFREMRLNLLDRELMEKKVCASSILACWKRCRPVDDILDWKGYFQPKFDQNR